MVKIRDVLSSGKIDAISLFIMRLHVSFFMGRLVKALLCRKINGSCICSGNEETKLFAASFGANCGLFRSPVAALFEALCGLSVRSPVAALFGAICGLFRNPVRPILKLFCYS